MKNLKLIATTALVTLTVSVASAQKLKKSFGSSIEKKIGPIKKRIPYTDVVSYLGHAAPNTEDEVKDGKKFYYIYVWVPAVAPELGLRMVSPAKKVKVKKPIIGKGYEENKDSDNYFDTYITLEKSDIVSEGSVANAANAKWTTLAKNDDSGEMPKQPSGRKYNSLLRYKSQAGNPLKALSRGLYRIGFTTYKKGEVKGTFLAQIGSPVKLPGVIMAKTAEEVAKQLKK